MSLMVLLIDDDPIPELGKLRLIAEEVRCSPLSRQKMGLFKVDSSYQ